MSDTTTTPPVVTPPIKVEPTKPSAVDIISEYGKIIVSVIALAMFGVGLYVTYKMGDKAHDSFTFLTSTVGNGFTLVLGFWLGSSYESAKKTDLLAKPTISVTPPT